MATCIESMGCWPTTVLEVWRFFEYQYAIPTSIVLGMFVGMIIVGIYLRTRSLAHLAVLGTYAIAVFSSMWLNDVYLEAQYHQAVYIIAVLVASVIVVMILKLVKE